MATKTDTTADMFAEVDIPAVKRIGTTKFVNPFLDVVKARKGDKKALTFNLSHITDNDDETETMERVVRRARRLLNEAGDAAVDENTPNGVTVRMIDNQNGTITFWVLSSKIEKKAKGDTTTEVAE